MQDLKIDSYSNISDFYYGTLQRFNGSRCYTDISQCSNIIGEMCPLSNIKPPLNRSTWKEDNAIGYIDIKLKNNYSSGINFNQEVLFDTFILPSPDNINKPAERIAVWSSKKSPQTAAITNEINFYDTINKYEVWNRFLNKYGYDSAPFYRERIPDYQTFSVGKIGTITFHPFLINDANYICMSSTPFINNLSDVTKSSADSTKTKFSFLIKYSGFNGKMHPGTYCEKSSISSGYNCSLHDSNMIGYIYTLSYNGVSKYTRGTDKAVYPMDHIYIYACCYDIINNKLYVYCAMPFYYWYFIASEKQRKKKIGKGNYGDIYYDGSTIYDIDGSEFDGNYDTWFYCVSGWTEINADFFNKHRDEFELHYFSPDEDEPYIGSNAFDVDDEDDEKNYEEYYKNLYSKINDTYSPFINTHSIIGLPFTFLSNTDLRYGYAPTNLPFKSNFGSEFVNNILYDMPLAVINPGLPKHENDNLLAKIYNDINAIIFSVKETGAEATGRKLLNNILSAISMKGTERFYIHKPTMEEYSHYVNTLCHIFAMFVGVSDMDCKLPNGDISTYGRYNDMIETIDENNQAFTNIMGTDPAVFIYYQPDSQLNQTFTTTTGESPIAGQVNSYAETGRNLTFFGEALNIDTGPDSLLGSVIGSVSDAIGGLIKGVSGVGAEMFSGVLNGNNINLPKVWSDSDTEVSHSLNIKLVSPYGDPESVFLYILRPLARLLALVLPRQTGPNSYRSPFFIQAFSKGQFNCQLGVVNSLSVTRGGNGGESVTVTNLPTEIDVSMNIEDLYDKIMMPNEYIDGNVFTVIKDAIDLGQYRNVLGMMFNNIGLIDFIASYSGYNLNSPSADRKLQFAVNFVKNRFEELIKVDENEKLIWNIPKLRFPTFEKKQLDRYHQVISRNQTFIST